MLVTLLSLALFAHHYLSAHTTQTLTLHSDSELLVLYAAVPNIEKPSHNNSTISSVIGSKHQPTPTPSPSPAPVTTTQSLAELFQKYSALYNVDRNLLIKIAMCESKLNPNAGKMYIGLFQFSENTWQAWRKRMQQNPDPSLRTNAEASIQTAAYMISQGQIGAWPTCGK